MSLGYVSCDGGHLDLDTISLEVLVVWDISIHTVSDHLLCLFTILFTPLLVFFFYRDFLLEVNVSGESIS